MYRITYRCRVVFKITLLRLLAIAQLLMVVNKYAVSSFRNKCDNPPMWVQIRCPTSPNLLFSIFLHFGYPVHTKDDNKIKTLLINNKHVKHHSYI